MRAYINADGSLNLSALEGLEQDLLAATSRLTLLDKLVSAAKMGEELVICFQCNHSGLFYPSDYVKGWGRSYGIGLGPDPVSEALNSQYDLDPPEITNATRRIEQIMHPVENVRTQVDLHEVPRSTYDAARAVLAKDDPFMEARARIVRGRQLVNPQGRLHIAQAAWERSRGKVGL